MGKKKTREKAGGQLGLFVIAIKGGERGEINEEPCSIKRENKSFLKARIAKSRRK